MEKCGLIFSRSGYAHKLYRVSPLVFPQFGLMNEYRIPKERDLPERGLVTRMYVFDFGFADPGNSIGPMDTQYCPLVMGRDFLVEVVTGVYAVQAVAKPAGSFPAGTNLPLGNQTPGFLVNFLHTHEGVQRQWSNKNITDIESVGDGQLPLVLKEPALLPQGDSIMCVIQNLSNATLQAQILFTGGEFDTETYAQESGVAE